MSHALQDTHPIALDESTDASSPFALLFGIIAAKTGKSGAPADWSSAIGIITAIVGNLLISLALNTQRYAHIRLDKEYLEREKHQLRSREDSGNESYGAIDGRIAKTQTDKSRRGKSTAKASRHSDEYSYDEDQDEDYGESDPLLGGEHSPDSSTTQNPEEVDDDTEEPLKKKNYLKSPWWWLGITLMVTGEAGNFLAYGFAPASIVSPLGVVALISNCMIAPIMLRERFRWRDALGVVISIGGAVTIVTSAAGSNPKLGPGTIWNLIRRWQFEAYLGITFGAIIVLMFLSNWYGHKIIVIDLGLVGLFGGYTALSTKGVASLISYRLWNVFKYPVFYLLVAVLVVTAIMQIKYLNRALQHFDSTQVIPTQFVMFTIFVIVGSAILYQDFEKKGGGTIGQFVGGCLLTFLGVWCLTGGRGSSKNEETDQFQKEEDEEQAIVMIDEEQPQPGQETNKNAPKDSPQTPHRKSRLLDKQTPGAISTLQDTPASFATANTNFDDPLDDPSSSSVPYIHATISSPVLTSDSGLVDNPFETPASRSRTDLTPPSFQASSTSPARPRAQQHASDSNLLDPENALQAQYRSGTKSGTSSRDSSQRYSMVDPATPSAAAGLSRSHTVHSTNSPRLLAGSMPGSSPLVRTPTRQSITSGMIPGPLTRPLGGGLSGLVADSRRREQQRVSSRRDSLKKVGTTRSRANSGAGITTGGTATLSRTKSGRRGVSEAMADTPAVETVPSAEAERVTKGDNAVDTKDA